MLGYQLLLQFYKQGNAVCQKDDILFTHNILFPTTAQSQLPFSYIFWLPILAIIRDLRYYKDTKAYHVCVWTTHIYPLAIYNFLYW
jgi:hypothetical protein